MYFLDKFFGNKKDNQSINPESDGFDGNLNEPEIEIPEGLFVNKDLPSEKEVVVKKENKLTEFMSRNYLEIGERDGFLKHSKEALELGKNKMKSEFRFVLDGMIEFYKGELLLKSQSMIEANGLSEVYMDKLTRIMTDIEDKISDMVLQKDLSTANEGWVMKCIYAYDEGFLQGFNDYTDSEDLLNTINKF